MSITWVLGEARTPENQHVPGVSGNPQQEEDECVLKNVGKTAQPLSIEVAGLQPSSSMETDTGSAPTGHDYIGGGEYRTWTMSSPAAEKNRAGKFEDASSKLSQVHQAREFL